MSANELRNSVFYTLKPLIPRAVQLFIRRLSALYKRRKYANVWPTYPDSHKAPQCWRGWPGGKQFALVLSHDVDTIKGYNDCLKLAKLEERLQFRSSYNFVPERYGRVSTDLLNELNTRGFGIGVHGLKHDGKLFSSRKIFDERVVRINDYLKEWKTKGFTAPSMIHNLEWMGSMDIEYATTTFDTDPFEPQPDGVKTIFPFWVWSKEYKRAYLELPYTLVQDFTLFVLLRMKDTQIWEKKLDWIADHGGMALLNTHPDYMDFEGKKQNNSCYPVKLYTEFLGGIAERYQGRFWNPLGAEVAAFFRERYPFDAINHDENSKSIHEGRQ